MHQSISTVIPVNITSPFAASADDETPAPMMMTPAERAGEFGFSQVGPAVGGVGLSPSSNPVQLPVARALSTISSAGELETQAAIAAQEQPSPWTDDTTAEPLDLPNRVE